MSSVNIFINRRHQTSRRTDPDPCGQIPLDLYNRKRRKSTERREANRSLKDDYHAATDDIVTEK